MMGPQNASRIGIRTIPEKIKLCRRLNSQKNAEGVYYGKVEQVTIKMGKI